MKNFPRALLLVRVLFLSASCIHSPAPPPPPLPHIDFAGIPACSLDAALPKTEDVCVGWFTVERGLACVKCPAARACVDSIDVVFCVANPDDCSDGGRCNKMGSAAGARKP